MRDMVVLFLKQSDIDFTLCMEETIHECLTRSTEIVQFDRDKLH